MRKLAFLILIFLLCAGAFADMKQERGIILSSRVLFDFAQSFLDDKAVSVLEELAGLLKVYPKNKIIIEGHTDSIGGEESNKTLSLSRAKAVQDFFVNKGIAADRISVYGLGASKPASDNSTESGQRKNRRAEILILKYEK